MKLQCSAGHQWDSEKASDRWWKGDKNPGDRCGMELAYDRMSGTRRCARTLKKPVEIVAIQRNGEWTWKMIGEKPMESSREFPNESAAIKDGRKIAKGCGLFVSRTITLTHPPGSTPGQSPTKHQP
jgi:hypothetical protein